MAISSSTSPCRVVDKRYGYVPICGITDVFSVRKKACPGVVIHVKVVGSVVDSPASAICSVAIKNHLIIL